MHGIMVSAVDNDTPTSNILLLKLFLAKQKATSPKNSFVVVLPKDLRFLQTGQLTMVTLKSPM